MHKFLLPPLALAGATGSAILGVDQNEGTAAAPVVMAPLPNAVCLPASEAAGVSSSDTGYNSADADIANGVTEGDGTDVVHKQDGSTDTTKSH